MEQGVRYRCQCTDDGRSLCYKEAATRVVAVKDGKEIRGSSAYACLDHAAGLSLVIATEHHAATVRIIELPNAAALVEARDGNR